METINHSRDRLRWLRERVPALAPGLRAGANVAINHPTRNVNVRVKRSRILQHTKGYVIDSRLLREGSANFSPSALKQQDNTLVLTNDTEALRSFEHSYEIEWDRPDNIPFVQFGR